MPAGRPKAITKDKEKILVSCFTDGLTDEETAFYCGISAKTIQRLRAGELSPTVKKAALDRKMQYLRKLRDGDRADWPRIAWYLERTWAMQFAKPEVQLQINNNTLNQTVNNTLIVTAEVAHGINSRVKEADAKIEKLLKDKRGSNGNGNGHYPEAKK